MIKRCILLAISERFCENIISVQSQNNTNFRSQYLGLRYKDNRELRKLLKVNSNIVFFYYGIAINRRKKMNIFSFYQNLKTT
jgi:hypothetical protein